MERFDYINAACEWVDANAGDRPVSVIAHVELSRAGKNYQRVIFNDECYWTTVD